MVKYGYKKKKEGDIVANVLTSDSAEKARELLAVLDKIHTNPPQYLTADEIEVIFEHAQKIRLQLSRLKK